MWVVLNILAQKGLQVLPSKLRLPWCTVVVPLRLQGEKQPNPLETDQVECEKTSKPISYTPSLLSFDSTSTGGCLSLLGCLSAMSKKLLAVGVHTNGELKLAQAFTNEYATAVMFYSHLRQATVGQLQRYTKHEKSLSCWGGYSGLSMSSEVYELRSSSEVEPNHSSVNNRMAFQACVHAAGQPEWGGEPLEYRWADCPPASSAGTQPASVCPDPSCHTVGTESLILSAAAATCTKRVKPRDEGVLLAH